MKRQMKRATSLLVAGLLAVGAPLNALAANWYLEDGDVSIVATEEGQTVSQDGGAAQDDANPVITQRDASTSVDSRVTVESSGNAAANLTLKDVNIETDRGPGLDVVGESTANVKIKGENSVVSTDDSGAAIHVAGGNLTLTGIGQGGSSAQLDVRSKGGDHAAIGTDEEEDLTGSININGDLSLTADQKANDDDGDGAAIGTGDHGHMEDESKIVIGGNAYVVAKSDSDGAGIGTGNFGDLHGQIIIEDDAYIDEARSDDDGAGIGTGDDGDLYGDIIIRGDAYIEDARSDDDGAGIGTGWDGHMRDGGQIYIGGNSHIEDTRSNGDGAGIGTGDNGDMKSGSKLHITDNAFIEESDGDDYGAGIGTGEEGDMDGLIQIDGNAKIKSTQGHEESAGIGTGEDGNLGGTILIGGNARIEETYGGTSDPDAAGIGTGDDGDLEESGKIIIEGNAYVKAIGSDDGAGIGTGNIDGEIYGEITIKDNAHVIALGGDDAAAIGTDGSCDMKGLIQILNRAVVETGIVDDDGDLERGVTGRIGGDDDSHHMCKEGHYVISTGATINGIKGGDLNRLRDIINWHEDGKGNPTNVTIIQEEETDNSPAPLYWVRTLQNRWLAHEDTCENGVLTIKVDADCAVFGSKMENLDQLMAEGVEKIVLVTNLKTTTVDLEILKDLGSGSELFTLTQSTTETLARVEDMRVPQVLK